MGGLEALSSCSPRGFLFATLLLTTLCFLDGAGLLLASIIKLCPKILRQLTDLSLTQLLKHFSAQVGVIHCSDDTDEVELDVYILSSSLPLHLKDYLLTLLFWQGVKIILIEAKLIKSWLTIWLLPGGLLSIRGGLTLTSDSRLLLLPFSSLLLSCTMLCELHLKGHKNGLTNIFRQLSQDARFDVISQEE